MSAPAKAPTRRLLATYRTEAEAAAGAIWWSGPPEKAKGVRVANARCEGRQAVPTCGWEGVFVPGQPAGVEVGDLICPDCGGRVALGIRGATSDRPFAVTAAKTSARGST